MISFWRIFSLELTAFVRSKALAMLLAASAAWMLVLPRFIQADGTVNGARELIVRYSLGGVFALLSVTLLASATGSLARERAEMRLQLTLVRPVRYAALVLAKGLAHLAVGALVLTVSGAILACRMNLSTPCAHVLKPILPSPRAEAEEMYTAFMHDPETPAAAKRASRKAVIRLLETKAVDHYQTIPTNDVVSWSFPALPEMGPSPSVRLKFTNQFDLRDDVRGLFTLGEAQGVVSNLTQAVLTIPLVGDAAYAGELSFRNEGKNPLMLRPRKDIDLLLPADAFGWNLLRTIVALVAILAVLIAFGLFLSAALGRPVALFVALVTLLVGEMSPSVVEQYPNELETSFADRLGLVCARAVSDVTRPFAAVNPLEKLSLDECVEPDVVGRAAIMDILLVPFLLALLSGFVLPRKTGI